jgi:Rps23 Pro-64 3,4-dihydroxylase Tpa1-like proline 4-hydroxylase
MKFTVIDDFLSPEVVRKINDEWPADACFDKKACTTSLKWSSPHVTPAAQKIVDDFDIERLEDITGIYGLLCDPDRFGAGLHCIPRGGFLNMHIDFNKHPYGWHRRVNVLIYLNEDWQEGWGGQLQLGCDNPVMIDPIAGRCVIFETTEDSWHGHPEPLKCPPDRQRRSLALYFYTKEPPPTAAHSTIYR